MSRITGVGWATFLTVAVFASDLAAQGVGPVDFDGVVVARRPPRPAGPGGDFNQLTQGAEKIDGLLTLYKKGEHLYAEFLPHQLNQELIVPVTVARGMGMTGFPIGRDDEIVLVFRRVDDRIQVVRRNIHFKAAAGTPLGKSVQQNYTDSVLMALPIAAVNPTRGMAPLIDLSDVFMTDFAELGLGMVDRRRCSWVKAKGSSDRAGTTPSSTTGASRSSCITA
jgi:hypothetical protein